MDAAFVRRWGMGGGDAIPTLPQRHGPNDWLMHAAREDWMLKHGLSHRLRKLFASAPKLASTFPVHAGGSYDFGAYSASSAENVQFTAPVTTGAYTMGCIAVIDSLAPGGSPFIMSLCSGTTTTNFIGRFRFIDASNGLQIAGRGATSEWTSNGPAETQALVADTWHTIAGGDNVDNDVHDLALDGDYGNRALNNGSVSGAFSGITNFSLGNLDDSSGPRLGWNGEGAEMWCVNVDWGQAEFEAQGIDGIPVLMVDPYNTVMYAPLWRDAFDIIRGEYATLENSPTVSPHYGGQYRHNLAQPLQPPAPGLSAAAGGGIAVLRRRMEDY